jgi:TatD DNase family protein
MWPPDKLNSQLLKSADGTALNHPPNLMLSYELLAQVRGMPVTELQEVIAANYAALFTF